MHQAHLRIGGVLQLSEVKDEAVRHPVRTSQGVWGIFRGIALLQSHERNATRTENSTSFRVALQSSSPRWNHRGRGLCTRLDGFHTLLRQCSGFIFNHRAGTQSLPLAESSFASRPLFTVATTPPNGRLCSSRSWQECRVETRCLSPAIDEDQPRPAEIQISNFPRLQ